MSNYLRGYEIEKLNNEWVYTDTKELTVETHHLRPCGYCKKHNTEEGHDGCLGTLKGGVINACCGHGHDEPYIQFSDGYCVRGLNALTIIDILKDK